MTSPTYPTPTSNTSLVDTGVGDKATRATFLSLFIIVGFVGNCVLIATIAQSSRLKNASINLCIISLAMANILDTAGNMPIILGATITEKWDYGKLACHFNAFGLQLVSIAVVLGLMLLVLDRFVAVLDPGESRRRLSARRTGAVIGFFWAYSVAFSVPLMLDSVVPIRVFPVRYLCTITNNTPLLYLCLTSIFCYLIPITLCLCFFAYIIHRAVRLRRKERDERLRAGYAQGSRPPDPLWAEIEGAKFAGVMFVIWLVLQAPYLVLSSITWYRNSRELAGNKAVSDFLYFEYPWELELALTWLRLSYPVFLPSVTFLWKKDVWRKLKNALCRRKTNLVVDASPRAGNGICSGDPANGVPVLFATKNGLHIQTYHEDESDEADPDSEARENSNSQAMVTRKCDVYGSQFLQLDDEDTSDYDSSGDVDPFSSSNPASVGTENGHLRSAGSGTGRLSGSRSRIGREPGRGSPEARLDAAAAATGETAPEVAGSKRGSNEQTTGQRSGGIRSGGGEAASPPEADSRVDDGVTTPEGTDDVCQATERTSHDSGMGSLGKTKKPKRRKKKKATADDNRVTVDKETCCCEQVNDVNCSELRTASPQDTDSSALAYDGKRRCKKRYPKQDTKDRADDIVHDEEAAGDVAERGKDLVRPRTLPASKECVVEQVNADPEASPEKLRCPAVPPRKVNIARSVQDIRRSEPVSRPVPEPRHSLGTPNVQERTPRRQNRSRPKPPVGEIQNSGGEHSDEEGIQRNCSGDGGQCCTVDVKESSNVDPGASKSRKKRRNRTIDREAQRRRMAQELDQEIQGVLY